MEAARSADVELTLQAKEDGYGCTPIKNPDDLYCLMFINYNSLDMYTIYNKINKIDGLIKIHQINTLKGYKAQCD